MCRAQFEYNDEKQCVTDYTNEFFAEMIKDINDYMRVMFKLFKCSLTMKRNRTLIPYIHLKLAAKIVQTMRSIAQGIRHTQTTDTV